MCKAKMAVYMLLDCVGRSPYRWEAPEECSLIGTLYIWEWSTGKERVRRDLISECFSNVRSCLVEDRSGTSEVGLPGNSGRPKVNQLRD